MGRLKEFLVIALMYVTALAIIGPRARISQWQVSPDDLQHAVELQPAVEALAWLDGRLEIPSRGGDVAEYNGKYYVHFPPFFTIFFAAGFWLHRHLLGDPPVFWGWVYVLIVAAPVPGLAFLVMRRADCSVSRLARPGAPEESARVGALQRGSVVDGSRSASDTAKPSEWRDRATQSFATNASAAALALYMLAGTCFWPVIGLLGRKNGGWIYSAQLIMAQAGLALLLIDLFGRRRLWVGGIGLIIAAWCRQPTILYAPALLWAAWRAPNRARGLMAAGVPLLVALAVPMGLSWAKFGSPFESGYQYIYAGRDDPLAQRARSIDGTVHVFHPKFMAENLYYYHICPPTFDLSPQGVQIAGQGDGTSLWIGSPLLLLVLWDARRWWRDPARRVLMLCTLLVNVMLLCYHYTGHDGGGYCRYTLDFTLVWLAVLAPWVAEPRRRPFVLACFAWSVFYFYMVT